MAIHQGTIQPQGVQLSTSCLSPHLAPFCLATELHSKLQFSEAEVKSKSEELSGLQGQLNEARVENSQLSERIRSIEALLEAGQARDAQVRGGRPVGDALEQGGCCSTW